MNGLVGSMSQGRLPTLLTNLGLLASGVGSSVIISRSLGPTARGEYVAWQAWAAAAAILALGGVPQVLALEHSAAGRHKLTEIALTLSVTLGRALPIVAVLALVVRLDWIVVVAAVLVVVATQLSAIGAAEAQRMGRMGVEFNLARIMPQCAALLAMGWLLWETSTSSVSWLVTIAAAQAVATVAWVCSAGAAEDRRRPSCRRH